MKDAYSSMPMGQALPPPIGDGSGLPAHFPALRLRPWPLKPTAAAIGGSASQSSFGDREVGEDLILSAPMVRYCRQTRNRAVFARERGDPLEPSRPLGPFSTRAQDR